MKNHLQEQAEQFKKRIRNENRKNLYKKRIFSRQLKRDIVLFVDQNNLGQNKACKLLGLHHSTISSWIKKFSKNGQFKKIKLDSSTKKNDLINNQQLDRVIILQTLQLAALTLLIFERAVSHLI